MTDDRRLISIVIPCLNEEAVLPELLERLEALGQRHNDCDFEFLLIDDGSRDGSVALLRVAAAKDDRFRILVFSRNFGQQVAASAGIDAARGAAVVLMDCDLQDPPEVVSVLVERHSCSGYRKTRDVAGLWWMAL